jgi:DNA-binding transcriptional ArsR family regulator
MDDTLTALAEPNRRRIVEALRRGPKSVGELVEELRLTQPLVSKHLRVLRQAHLVRVQPRAQQRLYELEPAPFLELGSWIGSFGRLWEERLDTLDDYLKDVQRSSKRTGKP